MAEWITSTMDSMGYVGVFLLMFLENVFPPIPSEVIMPSAGFASVQGSRNFWLVILAGTAGSLVGQLPLYYLGYWVSMDRLRRWAARYGKWLTVHEEDVDHARKWFERWGSTAVLVCRVVPGIRSLISIPAGACSMPLPRFLLFTGIGTVVWVTFLAWLGRLLGAQYEKVGTFLGPVTYIVFALLIVAVIAFVMRRKRRFAHNQSDSNEG
jgi:membrane protein DedA with SNARE-associated domain